MTNEKLGLLQWNDAPSVQRPTGGIAALEVIGEIRRRLNAALIGKQDVVETVLACVLARGHLLLEDVPGLGKTTLAKTLALSLGGQFNRVQCTPDLLPGDITGFSMFNQKSREFEFLPGPIFADVLLFDEINRATPRTQSALLEAMAEHQVTVDNTHHTLSPAFFVIATQNPIDHHGTHDLPEAQLDRFAMKLSIGYPGPQQEAVMLEQAIGRCCDEIAPLPPVLDAGRLHALQQQIVAIHVAPALREYLVRLAAASRSHGDIPLGISPRGLMTWQRVSQAKAFLAGRAFVTPEDIQDVAAPVLQVRLSGTRKPVTEVIANLMRQVPVPDHSSRGSSRDAKG